MDPEITYIRSTDMEQPQHDNQRRNKIFNGTFEWLKTAVFLGILFVVSFVAIRIVGPVLFADYVPGILGLTEASDESESPRGEEIDSAPVKSEDGETAAETEDTNQSDPEMIEEGSQEGTVSDSAAQQDEETAVNNDETTAGKAEIAPDEEAFSVYIVKPGDTLTSIAASNLLTVDEIIAANEFLNPHYLQLGQEIKIPLQ